jgi:hypothetical protein
MDKHINQHIKPSCKTNRTLCYECKNAIFLEKVDVWYATIYYWRYSLRATNEVLDFKSWRIGSIFGTFV